MILQYNNHIPKIDTSCYISSNSTIIGNVYLHKNASVWFGAVIRGDQDKIEIGEDSNIQDNCTLHTDPNHHLYIGNRVSVGHNATLHGCHIEDEVLIGMGATILNGATIGKHCIIGANALVMENMNIPDGSVVVGCPCKIIKQTSKEQILNILHNAKHYSELGKEYKEIEYGYK